MESTILIDEVPPWLRDAQGIRTATGCFFQAPRCTQHQLPRPQRSFHQRFGQLFIGKTMVNI